MNIYYIDYENVSSQGLKGVEALTENDEVNLLYSKKADNVKIEILTMLMASKAKIHFLPVHVGTPNALDFQLVTLLFLKYRPEDHCYIISKDSGYDCCIKTAAENGAPNVARYPNIESALNKTPAKKTRRGKRTEKETEPSQNPSQNQSVNPPLNPPVNSSSNHDSENELVPSALSTDEASAASAQQQDHPTAADAAPDTSPHTPEETAKKKTSRRRGRKKASSSENEPEETARTVSGDSSASKNTDSVKNVNPANSESGKKPNSAKSESGEKTNPEKADSATGTGSEHSPQEHVLSQRYLSNKFDQRNPVIISGAAKSDADKPVSILSVIRRRNDVQLDMHQIDLIREALKNASNKQQFYSYFVKNLGQKQGIELYQSVKSSYTDLVNANLL